MLVALAISIHALREEGDCKWYAEPEGVCVFLSTPSARRATAGLSNGALGKWISIHALREEGDCTAVVMGWR